MAAVSVLIVDDSESDRYILKRKLAKVGIVENIYEATDGSEALNFFAQANSMAEKLGDISPTVVIFLDVNMPRMSGFELLESFEKLKTSGPIFDNTTMMMFSSSERTEDKVRALSYDFVKGYIVKGDFTLDHLKAFLEGASVSL